MTDNGGLASEDTALIEIYGADLTLLAGGIVFAPVNPEPGQPVLIMATVANQGVVDSPAAIVAFFAFDDLLGTATVASLTPGETADVSIQPVFASAGLRLITVQVDPDNAIRVRAIRATFEDVDGDGDLDLILHFDMEQIVSSRALDADSVDAVLNADFDGDGSIDLLRRDSVRIVPSSNGRGDGKQ